MNLLDLKISKFAFENKVTLSLMFLFSILATLCLMLQPFLFVLIFNLLKTSFLGEVPLIKETSSTLSFFNLNNLFISIKKIFSNFDSGFDEKKKIIIYSLVFIFISFLYLIFSYLNSALKAHRETNLSFQLRKLLQIKILKYDLLDFNKIEKGYFQSTFIKDVEDFSILPGKFINGLLTHSLQVLICIIFLISTDLKLSLIVLIIFFFHFIYNKLLSFPLTKASKARYLLSGKVSGILIDYLNNYRNYKLSSDQYNQKFLSESFNDLRNKEFKIELLDVLQNPARFFINNIAIITIISVVTYFLFLQKINLETAFLFIFFCRYATTPISGLTTTLLWGKVINTAFFRIQRIFEYESKILEGNIDILTFKNEIEFKNVDFNFGTNQVFKDLSFKIKKNKHNLIIGDNGSGKSTLLDLLIRLIDPIKGNIFIDTVDIKNLKLKKYHKIFSYISQNNTLINSTIEQNLVFGTDLKKTDENYKKKIREALNLVDGLFVYELEKDIHNQVGEDGNLLSGGQKQKILIANAILRKSQIIIFDESSSALDKKTKINFQNLIKRISKDITVIEVNHEYNLNENHNMNLIKL